ncbi:hypothetical protein HBH64_017910 [Parastagonospora nodorum]|nr:hypothetical protein HBH52_033990 [Parastagonospora nodorum]KAH4073118.1 hypothetical protein HBH50_050070 [Parastagonospora nodorum]KAH4099826.1 hypothetical protein HBH48_012090 [Parastagonospora nodorum]KAH4111163.1 hypothetical protein HBH46_011630 [Parastagonospora nodorum]KAH4298826.1 hypothetical protein HBI01_127010 [Parastagonospora nodorum]
MSLPNAPAQPGPSKVAIPKLVQTRTDAPRKAVVSRLNRVNRACLSCRSRKIKCNGAKPTCFNCKESVTSCVYASSRKDRLKTATGQNQDMIELLKELREQVSGQGQDKIDELLLSVVEDVADASASLQKNSNRHDDTEGDQDDDQEPAANTRADTGNSADQDLPDGDAHATRRASRPFETAWNHMLRSHPSSESQLSSEQAGAWSSSSLKYRPMTPTSAPMQTNKLSFFLDDEPFEMDHDLDPFELPPLQDAERLLVTYMDSCHESFPFLAKKPFTQQFYHYYAALKRGNPYNLSQTWQTQLNLVFAIGAVRSHLTSTQRRGDERDHSIYHARALALILKDPWCFSRMDLPQMQITGLLAFYHLSVGHINKSWILSGMALRFGYALGLHTCNQSSTLGPAKKEMLSRIWWAHYTLERLLATLTSRPSVGVGGTCSVPLPLPLSSEEIEDAIIESRFGDQTFRSNIFHAQIVSSPDVATLGSRHQYFADRTTASVDATNPSSYLKSMVQLNEIAQDALSLYPISAAGQSWQGIPGIMLELTGKLELWIESLPDVSRGLKFPAGSRPYDHRERNMMDIVYHSTVILINRPCMCRLDRRITNQPARLNEFNQRSALTCVESAKAVARLLPDSAVFDVALLYESGPWWNMVHTIMQSLIVLLLEISYEAIQLPHDRREIIQGMKKLVRWLRAMRSTNGMARRAYIIVMNLFRALVNTVNMDIEDLFREDEQATLASAAEAQASLLRNTSGSSAAPRQPAHVDNRPFPKPLSRIRYSSGEGSPDQLYPRSPTYTSPYSVSRPETADSSAPVYFDVFSDLQDTCGPDIPSFFFTNFDEQNPLPGFGGEDHAMSGVEFQAQRVPSVVSMLGVEAQQ